MANAIHFSRTIGYTCQRVEIPKPDGGIRKLGVPCVVDRLIAGVAAGPAKALGSNVLRAQLRLPSGTLRPPGGNQRNATLPKATASLLTSTSNDFSTELITMA